MKITPQDIKNLENAINSKLAQFNTLFVMTAHFTQERINDERNQPPITLVELESIFDRLIEQYILAIVALNDGDSFNIRCTSSHINIPCRVNKTTDKNGTVSQKNIVVTIMRKESFFAKDPIEFVV